MPPKTCEEYVVERCKYLEERCGQLIKATESLEAKVAELQEFIEMLGNYAAIRPFGNGRYLYINIDENEQDFDIATKMFFPEALE